MKINWKNLLILISIVLIDFVLIIAMRMILPKIFIVVLGVIIVLALGSILTYYFIVKPQNWIKESIFISITITILTFLLTLVLHVLIEHNLQLKNFSVTLVAMVIPFICGGIYSLNKK